MANIVRWDDMNIVRLTEGYMPDLQTMKAALPRNPLAIRAENIDFETDEESLAWILTRKARTTAYYIADEFQGAGAISRLALETWVLGPPSSAEGRFEDWFKDEPSDTRYRIIIHRTPRCYWLRDEDISPEYHPINASSNEVPEMFWRLYSNQRRQLQIEHRKVPLALRKAIIPAVDEILKTYREGEDDILSNPKDISHVEAYRKGTAKVESLLKQWGHPFRYSNGLD